MSSIDETDARPVRTGELTEKVWRHFGPGYTKLTQVRAATGWADMNTADMMVMGEWPSTGNELHGFEIKVSRSDWLNEVKHPTKNQSVKSYCDRWWLVIADETMVKEGELPDDWGMLSWQGRGKKLRVVKKAPKLDAQTLDHCFVASLLRHNEKEMLPIDVHKDALRDAARDAAAFEKKKSAELFQFVRTLVTGLGIDVRESKDYDYTRRTKVFTKWTAQVKGSYIGSLGADQLSDMLQKVAAFQSMQSDVQVVQRRLQEIVDKGRQVDSPEYVLPWAEWALRECSKVLGETEQDRTR